MVLLCLLICHVPERPERRDGLDVDMLVLQRKYRVPFPMW